MEYAIDLIEEQCYIQVIYTGVADLDIIKQSRDELETMVETTGWNRILVDNIQLTITISITRQFEIVKVLPWNTPGKIKSAILIRPEEAENFSFIEDVSINRGSIVKFFLDHTQALEWLLAD